VPINSPRYRWSELDGEQRAELNQQIVDLTEAFVDDITHLQAGQSFAETTLVDYLPRQFLPHYNLAFARRFLVAFLTVTWKLTDPEAVHNCANQAEELALYALIQATRDALPPGEDDLEAFGEAVYETAVGRGRSWSCASTTRWSVSLTACWNCSSRSGPKLAKKTTMAMTMSMTTTMETQSTITMKNSCTCCAG
jgi:hypothetical protein